LSLLAKSSVKPLQSEVMKCGVALRFGSCAQEFLVKLTAGLAGGEKAFKGVQRSTGHG